jgi:hypothetical protein
MNHSDRLKRPDHHLEFNGLASPVSLYQVDAVDPYAVQFGLEFQHGVRGANDFSHVLKRRVEEHLEYCAKIARKEFPAALRREQPAS